MALPLSTGALQWLAPLVELFGVASGVLAGMLTVLMVFALLGLATPSALALLARDFGAGLSRWPALWLAPSVGVYAAFAVWVTADGFDARGEVALWIYVAWATLAAYVALPHLLLRAVKFVARGPKAAPRPRRFLWLYGWAALAVAGVLVVRSVVAFDASSVGSLLVAVVTASLGVLHIRRRGGALRAPSSAGARFAWVLFGAVLALAAPFAVACGVLMVLEPPQTEGFTNGHMLTVLLALLAAGAFAAWLLAARKSTAPDPAR